MRPGSPRRAVVVGCCVLVALVLQVTVLPPFAWSLGGADAPQVAPDLVLLVVVAVALLTDARLGTLTGFAAGLLLDLAPPADHVAGRWALALMLVGYVVGRLAHDDVEPGRERLSWPLVIAAAAGGSFVGSSVYALSGVLLGEGGAPIGALLVAVLVGAAQDAVAALVVFAAVRRALEGRGSRATASSRRPARLPRPAASSERPWARVG